MSAPAPGAGPKSFGERQPFGRVLGVDHGDRWFGLAVSDESATLARPLAVCDGEAACVERIAAFTAAENVRAIVVGLPRNMDGSEGPKAAQVRAFAERLADRFPDLATHLHDERLTTVEAEERLAARGARRGRERERVDAIAAGIILQSFLDASASR